MKKIIKIGATIYPSKKDALAHYKNILNSYQFGQSLNDKDFDDILDLLDLSFSNYLLSLEDEIAFETSEVEENQIEDNNFVIQDIRVSKVQFNTRCFEIFYSNESQYISYIMIINNQQYTPERLFYVACRNAIYSDIVAVKQQYFKANASAGLVKCQETSKMSRWDELVVDHRQPNTFSIIVDRFKELNNIKLNDIEYISNKNNMILFKDNSLLQKFKEYHLQKATLRVVRKEYNASRTALARVKSSSKDLSIKPTNQLPLF